MRLNFKRPNGTTLREVLLASEKASGRPESGLRIDIPPSCTELWETFCGLASRRRSGLSAQPLVWSDIEAWCAMYRAHLSAWELDTLCEMDAAGLRAVAEEQAAHPSTPTSH